MRQISIRLLDDATATQLLAFAALVDQEGRGEWARLATLHSRLEQKGAVVPPAMGELLDNLAVALRRAGADRGHPTGGPDFPAGDNGDRQEGGP